MFRTALEPPVPVVQVQSTDYRAASNCWATHSAPRSIRAGITDEQIRPYDPATMTACRTTNRTRRPP